MGYSYLSTSRGAGNSLTKSKVSPSLLIQIPIYLERGRKPVFFLIREIQYALYRYLSTSRGAGNLKATKLKNELSRSCIATYLPREGPETYRNLYFLIYRVAYSYLSTSRGAGNLLISEIFDSIFFVYLPIYLARGRKHNFRCAERSLITYRYLSISRGGGNRNDQNISSFGSVQIPIYLARGRKLCS